MPFTCPLCGSENEDGRAACTACGAKLSAASVRPVAADAVQGTGIPREPASMAPERPVEVRLRDPIDDPWFADELSGSGAATTAPRSPQFTARGAAPEAGAQPPRHEEFAAPGGGAPGVESAAVQEEEAPPQGEAEPEHSGIPPTWPSSYGQQATPQFAQYPYPLAPGVWPYPPQPFAAPYQPYQPYPGYPPHPFFGYPPPCPLLSQYGYGQPYPNYPPQYAAAAYQAPSYGSPYTAPYQDAYSGYAPVAARGPRKTRSTGLIIGIVVLLLAIAGGVTAAFLLTSSGKASFNLGDGAVTGANIEFRGVTLTQDGSTLTLSGTYDNTAKREGEVTATVQALTGGAEQLIAFAIPVKPGTGVSFSKKKAESVKLNGATLGPLLFSSSGSLDETGLDDTSTYPSDENTDGTTTPKTTPGTSPSEQTSPGSTGTTYPGYPGTFPSFPYGQDPNQ